MAIRFVYFDLGNVLLAFSHPRMIEQMAAEAGAPVRLVHDVIFAEGLGDAYEKGEVTPAEFHQQFCAATGREPNASELERACSDIFTPIAETIELAGELKPQVPLGILSNTNHSHWSYVREVFPQAITPFGIHALSFELKAMKPAAEIYVAATKLADVDPAEILFLDDRADNVAGARAAGWDAEVFTSAADARRLLRNRGFAV